MEQTLKSQIEVRIRNAEAKGHLATAIELLEYYQAQYPGSEYYAFLYADNLRAVGRCLKAESLLLSLAPTSGRRRYLVALSLGRLYEGLGKAREAEEAYTRATKEYPSTTVPWVFLGNFLKLQGRLLDARSAYENGLAASGDIDEVNRNLGSCMLALRDFDAASNYFSAALDLRPNYEEARIAIEDVREAMLARKYLADIAPPSW